MAITWDRVQVATTASDTIMERLLSIIEADFPTFRHQLPTELQKYYQYREHLQTSDGVILYKERIVIPPSLRHHILSTLHSAHQGVSSMNGRAEATIF